MRRFWIILLVMATALVIAIPAGAAKPPINCDKTPNHPACAPAPPVIECVFVDGVLQAWGPPDYDYGRCQWTVPFEERSKTFHFSLELVPEVEGATVNLPHLIVTDIYPYGGDICFNEYVVGWSELPYSWSSFTLPSDGECNNPDGGVPDTDGPDVFAITIDVGKVKKGAVQLTYTTTG